VSDEPEVLDMNALLRIAAGKLPAEGGPEADMNTLIRQSAGRSPGEPAERENEDMNTRIRKAVGAPLPQRPEPVNMTDWIRMLSGRGPVPPQVEALLEERAKNPRWNARVSQMTRWIRARAGYW